MPKPVVLMGFAEALSAPESAWSLADAGYRVVAFGRRGKPAAVRHSKYVEYREITAPEADLDAARADVQTLMQSLAGESEKTLFPLDDAAVLLCKLASESDASWNVAGARGECAALALNKKCQTDLAREAGFHVPTTWLVRTPEEAREIGRTQAFPLILRPVECVPVSNGRIQKGKNWICADAAELESAIATWGGKMALLVQPYIRGNGEGVFGFATEDGVAAWSAHRRLRMMNPHGSGSSACISRDPDPETRACAEEMIRRSGWRGLFMIELLRDESGKVWFVELNGRPWGSLALSRRQGLEYPAWQVQTAAGGNTLASLPSSAKAGVVCRNIGRELMHVLFVARGPKSSAIRNWPSLGGALRGVFGVGAKDGIYNWRRDDPKVFFADCYNTIHGNVFKGRG